ncbi:MAG: peptidoglycan DD-metalloendopeptidase family protein [Gammaproteobacteria bacterium]|nr:peptidoglycan DD-metalloendopeptidase family protein [Gammaproteobacteria bacterium]
MVAITQSVGVKGTNQRQDVLELQKAFNKIKPYLIGKPLAEDGSYGKNTADAIIAFQSKYVKMIKPDGRIDPTGKSITVLNQLVANNQALLFPLTFKPSESYKSGMRAFGSDRSGGTRKHAGCDLYAPKGTPIRAIKDGTVIQSYPFYLGTRALEVNHGDIIVRYGEISHTASGITPGANVKRGQVIAYIGELVFPGGNKMSMLHIEFYKGTLTGPLTVNGALPYKRRADLVNPTHYLDAAIMN